mmetsp:Transcript_30186/g.54797  ORF Transcript_30186/g.54797 Transcript_30186/m.54797 type:complete len:289 (-) Transcript_30186:172-1038(-)|eukprot:CAMPEP_0197662332 /NCGR_PEP_ID=MMETSP1338-20131121/52963_1 /TAXON_ID=43686 ORGANISM="Pelagodinium beii, Strain RCC1491" /NCGR_SAMPLE_ID=MMETSP1338 /ASSEMBLY_ACC=CAM_ASM_000754 /LENGTH=288 /DNA_ID=CAMNT_0043240135 /DNA_START=8 /DNA_END=874 /DNA_ORIENTATION=-
MRVFSVVAALTTIGVFAGQVLSEDCKASGRCAALQEDAEVGFTQLLQADSRALHSQKAKVLQTARHKLRGDILESVYATLQGPNGPGPVYSPYETEFREAREWVDKNRNLSADDPQWETQYTNVQRYLKTNNWQGMQYTLMASWQDHEKFAQKSCYVLEAGSVPLTGGNVADAFYCGAQHLGIDWSPLEEAGYQVADLCSAKVGTANNPDGICGSVGHKKLLLNFIDTVKLWGLDPVYINVPSLDCIMDLVDSDIYYCQTCANHCEKKPLVELARPESLPAGVKTNGA